MNYDLWPNATRSLPAPSRIKRVRRWRVAQNTLKIRLGGGTCNQNGNNRLQKT